MTGDAVLIAAFSGRSLAQSARRAGYRPYVADAFGDLDTKEAAEDVHVIAGAMETGFHTKPLITALDQLSAAAGSNTVGLVLGSGFEDKPRLVAALASRYRLLGTDAATLAATKDPRKFFPLLDELHIPHPKTQIEPPPSADGWISKRIGGSGGRHIRDCRARPRLKAHARRYFQKRISGSRYSIGALLNIPVLGGGTWSSFTLTRQWTAPSAKYPYRFGGCVSGPDVEFDLHRDLVSMANSVAAELALNGMASFDFIVDRNTPNLLEVNPRPGASLDVIDDADGNEFRAHMAVYAGPAYQLPSGSSNRRSRAMAILHADRGTVVLGRTPWPDWSADRGGAGTIVPEGAPLATVSAEAPTADAAEALARTRLAELGDLIYEHARSRSDRSAKW